MKITKLALMLAISGALVACESMDSKVATQIAESGASQMTAGEIRTAMVGNSIYERGKTQKGNPFQYTGYYKDGTITARSWGSGWDENDTATWTINENNEYCRAWGKWREGKEGCFKMYRLSDTEIAFEAVSGSAKSGISTMEAGNPYNL